MDIAKFFHSFAFLRHRAGARALGYPRCGGDRGRCDAGKWPLSAVQKRFGGTLPALANGDALPALGAPALVNLSLQGDVAFPHPPGRTGKANPAYAAVIKLGAQPAGDLSGHRLRRRLDRRRERPTISPSPASSGPRIAPASTRASASRPAAGRS